MEKLPMCRICLVKNVRMYKVVNKYLHELYEKLTDVPFVTEDSKPMLACFFCCTKLKQCWRFQRKCLDAEEMFAQMMNGSCEKDPLLNSEHFEVFNGFIKSSVVHISIDNLSQTESKAIKKELPDVWERHDNIIDPELHQTYEIKVENMDNSYLDVKHTPAYLSDSDSEDMPLIKIKTEKDNEQEYIVSEQENVDNSYDLNYTPAPYSESDSGDVEPVMQIKIEVEDEEESLEMPRVENRKVGGHTHEQMRDALQAVKDGKSMRQAAAFYNIPYSTLQRYQKRLKERPNKLPKLTQNCGGNHVFSNEQELILKDNLKKFVNLFHGLSVIACKQLAYEMAKMYVVNIPRKWTEKNLACLDWLRRFRQRHPDLILSKPEACLAKASVFNRETVNKFYDDLENAIKSHPAFSDGTRIYNLDETDTSIVHKSQWKMASKKKKYLCKVTSDAKESLVTTCNIISAGGDAVPPVLIFPKKNTNPHMATATPPGSLILANPTGLLNSELFVNVIKHFIRKTGSSKDHPSILIMDNHESHLSIEAFDIAKESGVTVLVFHPHISSRLQPLEVGIHGPYKMYFYAAKSYWLSRHRGCNVTMNDVGPLIGKAFAKAMTRSNIKEAFKKTGIFPFNRHIFSDEDFTPSTVPDCSKNKQPVVVSSVEATIPNQEQFLELEVNPLHLQTPDSVPTTSSGTAEETHKRTLSPVLLEIMGDTGCPASAPMPLFKPPETSTSNDPTGVLSLLPDCSARQPVVNRPITVTIITPDDFRKLTEASASTEKRKERKLGRLIDIDIPVENAVAEQKSRKRKKDQI